MHGCPHALAVPRKNARVRMLPCSSHCFSVQTFAPPRIEYSDAGEREGAIEMAKVLCATCGIQTETGEEARILQYGGRVFYFCSEACMELFLADPKEYLGGAPEPDTSG